MHNTAFSRFAAAGIAVAPLTLVSALVWIDGSHAGQAMGQRDAIAPAETTAQTGSAAKPRAVPRRRAADATLDSLGYGADALVFGRASASAPAPSAIGPTGHHGGHGDRTDQSRAEDWAAGLAHSGHAAMPYGRSWIAAPPAAWDAGRSGVSSAFAAPTGSASPGAVSENPAGSASTPQLLHTPENPVAVLTAASRGATPAESTEEPLALLTAPLITAREATSRAIPEPSALALALGALGLAGIGHRSRRPARLSGR